MLKNSNPNFIIFANFMLMIAWHLVILLLCRILPSNFFSSNKFIYKPRKWEKNGNFYVRVLKIKKWKDKLPQFVAKEGFSKKNLNTSDISKEYLERFILETCRAEWNHLMCCMYGVVSFFINYQFYAILFSIIPIAANLPFLVIQRFNRLRLVKLADKKVIFNN